MYARFGSLPGSHPPDGGAVMPAELVGEGVGAPAVVVGWAAEVGVGWAAEPGVGCGWFAEVGFAADGGDGCAPSVGRACPSGAIDGPLGAVSCERLVQPGVRVARASAATMAEMRRTEADFWFRVMITIALSLPGERRYVLVAPHRRARP